MIIGTGVDIVDINRVNERIAKRILGTTEVREFERKKHKKQYIAGRFAAKEAFFKALGTGLKESSFQDVEFITNSLGKPVVLLHRDFPGFNYAHVSISHDTVAIAQVVLEKQTGGIILSLGSNLGNRFKNMNKALEMISRAGMKILKKAPIYETEPYGYTDQPRFYNSVIEIDTDKTPLELLRSLLEIETHMGRVRTKRWGPRIIDLDILLFGNIIFKTQDLEIPHYDMLNRPFLLTLLNDIDRLFHPIATEVSLEEREHERCKLITKLW